MPFRRPAAAAFAAALVLVASQAEASTYTLMPGMAQAAVASTIAKLMPGDTLTLMPGDYAGVDLDLMRADMSGVAGTAAAHITIAGVPDAMGNLPHVIANTDNYQEAMRLRTGCAYIDISNLHLSAKGGQTQAGILVDSGVHDVSIANNVIEDVTGIGIQIQTQSDVHDLLIEHNAIYDTGTNTSDGNNGGQGFTAGGFDASSATKNVYHLVVRGNLVHDTTGQEGDCLKFMYGVYASIFEDNVMYNCPRGVSGQTENYGITSYGSGVGHYTIAADDNVVQRNLVFGTARAGHSNVAIYVGPGTQVLNNVIIQSNQGIAARLESEASSMQNLTVVNNTVLGATDYAFSIRGCQQADKSVVVTNNVFIANDANGYGYRMPDPVGSMIATANYYQGLDYAEASPPVMNKLTAPLSAIFVNPTTSVPGADLMPAPGSPLLDKGDPATAPPLDFDLAMRPSGAGPDVGAYERGAASTTDGGADGGAPEHWGLELGFKGSTAKGGIPDTGGPGAGGAPGTGGSGSGSPGGCKCSLPGERDGGGLAPALALAVVVLARNCRARRSKSNPTLSEPRA